MGDLIFKLRLLHMMLRIAFDEWRKDIWWRDLDATYCCGGHECGCKATTTREFYSWRLEKAQRQ